MSEWSPFAITIMFECYACANPGANMRLEQWNSPAAEEVRSLLLNKGLIDDELRVTPRGVAWVKFICATPLPEQTWILPDRVKP